LAPFGRANVIPSGDCHWQELRNWKENWRENSDTLAGWPTYQSCQTTRATSAKQRQKEREDKEREKLKLKLCKLSRLVFSSAHCSGRLARQGKGRRSGQWKRERESVSGGKEKEKEKEELGGGAQG